MDAGSTDKLRSAIATGLEALTAARYDTSPFAIEETAPAAGAVEAALSAALMVLDSTLGECRMAVPYKPLRPVRDASGNLRWCCTHDPEHC